MIRKSIVLYGLVIWLVGCGFHLRGTVALPPWVQRVSITIESAHTDLYTFLKDKLEAAHVNVVDDPRQASLEIIVMHDETHEDLISVGASTTPRQYQLVYEVHYMVKKGHHMVIPKRLVRVVRPFTVNVNRILGSDFEENLIKKEMRQDAATQILNSLDRPFA